MNCNIVRDLLPSYIDGLCSTETEREIKEHLMNCDACKKVYEAMQTEITDEIVEKLGMKNDEKQQELSVLRSMKKVMKKRLAAKIVSLSVAILTILFMIVLVLAQFHPEWEILNYQQYVLRTKALRMSEKLIEGESDSFLNEILLGMEKNDAKEDERVKQMVINGIDDLQKQYLSGKNIKVKVSQTYWNEGNREYGVTTSFIGNEGEVGIVYLFENEDTYVISGQMSVSSDCDEKMDLLKYSNGICKWVQFYQLYLCKGGESLEHTSDWVNDIEGEITLSDYIGMLFDDYFTSDCVDLHLENVDEDGFAVKVEDENVTDWSNNFTSAMEQVKLIDIIEKIETFDETEGKMRITTVWKFEDEQMRQGVMLKDFYWGPAGLEPTKEKALVLAEGMDQEVLDTMAKIFEK